MPTVTLLAKTYGGFHQEAFDKILKPMLKGLEVETKICGVTSRGWIQVAVSGEDENAALRYLADEIGLCPTYLSNVEKFSTMKGCVTALNKGKDKLYVDVGVFSPNTIDAAIPLQRLQAQLVDGRKFALKKLVELFGFCENLPLTVKVCGIDEENGQIEAMLSEKQLRTHEKWIKSLLDRLIILGAPVSQVRWALKTEKCNRDVIDIESLGLFEHALVCKLGTDARGLIPKIGKTLKNANLSVFTPRKILSFIGNCYS